MAMTKLPRSQDRRRSRSRGFIRRAGRLALLAFPEDFRARQGRALLQTLTADVRGSSAAMAGPRLIADLADAVRSGIAERVARRGGTSMGTMNQRAGRGGGPAGRWMIDLQHAWRSMRMRPGSSAATIMVYALGVGLATAMFALADPYFLRPLPYANPHELAVIQLSGRGGGRGGPPPEAPTLDAWRARTDLFQGVAAYTSELHLRTRSDVGLVEIEVTDITTNFFEVLGTRDVPPPPPVGSDAPMIVLTSRGRRMVPDAVVVGVLDGESGVTARIAGFLPRQFLFPAASGAVEAVRTFETGPLRRVTIRGPGAWSTDRPLTVIARVRPGATSAGIAESLTAMMPPEARHTVAVKWLSDVMTGRVRPLAMGALAAGVLILLVCAGNVANLLAARGAWRAREFATRTALGASRRDILRLRFLELALTAAVSGAVGLVLCWLVLTLAARSIPSEFVTLGTPSLTWRAAIFAGLATVAVVLVAILPMLLPTRSARLAPQESAGTGGALNRLRLGFTAVQSALSLVLAVGAAMLLQSYANLERYDLGMERTSLTVSVRRAQQAGRAMAFDVQPALERLGRIPGVEVASARYPGTSGRQFVVNGVRGFAFFLDTAPGFFDAAGMRVLQGRALAPGDEQWRAVVVNDAFARTHWPDRSPLGEMIVRDAQHAQVVGVVRDVPEFPFTGPATPRIYALVTEISGGVQYVLRATGDPRDYVGPIQRALAETHPTDLIGELETVGGQLAERVRDRTFAMLVLTLFAAAACAVTIAGLMGMVSFLVARRTREIAIRVAIGARPAHIRQLVAREALVAAGVGAAVGLLTGRWLSTWLESFVFGIEAGNWTTAFAATVAAVTLMAFGALLPARRAMKLQPSDALRVE